MAIRIPLPRYPGHPRPGVPGSARTAARLSPRGLVLVLAVTGFGALVPQLGAAAPVPASPTAPVAGFTGLVREEIRAAGPEATSAVQAAARAATPTAIAEIRSACADRGPGTYKIEDWKLSGAYSWYYNPAGAPRAVAGTAGLKALRAATSNVARGASNCGGTRVLRASEVYRGATARHAEIKPNGYCFGSHDQYSVASWMRMTTGALAVTCTWWVNGKATTSDVAINTKYQWFTSVPRGCRFSFDLQSVMTHERGHTFGLGHVSAAHRGQTMTPTIPPCDTTKRTLGGGDLAGLFRLYGSR